jgi:hypothetical protein
MTAATPAQDLFKGRQFDQEIIFSTRAEHWGQTGLGQRLPAVAQAWAEPAPASVPPDQQNRSR